MEKKTSRDRERHIHNDKLRDPIAWAQIGLIMIAPAVGSTIGPPADMEYPVEPVGVERMMPSPEKEVIRFPSQEAEMLMQSP